MGALLVRKRAWQLLVFGSFVSITAATVNIARVDAAPAGTLKLKQQNAVVVAIGTGFTPQSTVKVTARTSGGAGSKAMQADAKGNFVLGFTPGKSYAGPVTVTAGAAKKSLNFKIASTGDSSPKTKSKTTGNATLPSQVLDLKTWKLTLPIGEGDGDGCKPKEILQPALNKYTDEWFKLNKTKDGVVFRANADGCTTSNSGYPRSELREMNADGSNEAEWSIAKGTHTMTIRQAVTHLPVKKPETVIAQIHGGEDDIMAVIADGKGGSGDGAAICFKNGDDRADCLDDNYKLGTPFDLKIVASNGKIDLFYNGAKKGSLSSSDASSYFKVGNYTQSNPTKGDSGSAYGETVVYSVKVTHS